MIFDLVQDIVATFAAMPQAHPQFRFGDEYVQRGGTLKRGAVGNVEEPAAIFRSIFSLPLGDVQRRRRRSPLQLILNLAISDRRL